MKATWIDKNLENKRAHDYQQRIHQAKLNQIAQAGAAANTAAAAKIVKPNEARQVEAHLKKYKAEKKKNAQFQQSEKNIVIGRENQILLSKLVDISNGKWSSVPAASQAGTRKRATQSQTRVYQPTSLNLANRKKETERIERENHAFAKRLFDKRSVVDKKNLDKAYMDHLKYRRQIQKMPAKGKRAQTRGAAGATGMSNAQLLQDGQEYPRQPSHYLNQVPVMAQSADQMEAFEDDQEVNAANDSTNLVMEQNQQEQPVDTTQQQPAQQQPMVQAGAEPEESKSQSVSQTALPEQPKVQPAPTDAHNNNEQQVTK